MMLFRYRAALIYFLLFSCSMLLVFVFKTGFQVNEVQQVAKAEFFVMRNMKNEEVATTMEHSSTTTKAETLKNILECNDKFLEEKVDYHGEFIVFNNFVKAEREFKCHESITLSAPGDFRFLDNVVPLVDRWKGPISIALYAPGYDFLSTLKSIAYLRKCETPLIKKFVSFHLFLEHDHIPNMLQPLLRAYEDRYDCKQKAPYEVIQDDELYKTRHNLTYPINLARNIAKLNAQTHFVFPSDIELYPTRKFIPLFLDFVRDNPEYVQNNTRNVFVLPIFEIMSSVRVPERKSELQHMLKNKSAILFHQNVCSLCHKVPFHDRWVLANETQSLDVFTVGKRHGKHSVWEPFFVCTQKEPLWDERFNWEGQSNKMCQAYHLCMLDYNFVILDNAFLTHKPGVKKKKVQILRHQDQIAINSRYMKELERELPKLYGSNKNCRVTYRKPVCLVKQSQIASSTSTFDLDTEISIRISEELILRERFIKTIIGKALSAYKPSSVPFFAEVKSLYYSWIETAKLQNSGLGTLQL